jgi:hypothetical protein
MTTNDDRNSTSGFAEVEESVAALRRERATFVAALRLLDSLQSDGLPNLPKIVLALNELRRELDGSPLLEIVAAWANEAERAREDMSTQAARYFVSRAGHEALAIVLGSSEVSIFLVSRGPRLSAVELPPIRLEGIRQFLYHLLRRDYLGGEEGRRRIGFCPRVDCSRVFEVGRLNQRFCDTRCSRVHRQRDYYARRGCDLRRQRLSKQRKARGKRAK